MITGQLAIFVSVSVGYCPLTGIVRVGLDHSVQTIYPLCAHIRSPSLEQDIILQLPLSANFTVQMSPRHWQLPQTHPHPTFLYYFNPLNPELNPICYLLAILAHHFLHVSRIRVKSLTLRLLMIYIYIYIYMEHLFLMFLDHTQRRTTVGRTPLDE